MEYSNILGGRPTNNLCQSQGISDINDQSNLCELLFLIDAMSESNIQVGLIVNNNTSGIGETNSLYITNPDIHASSIADDKHTNELNTKSLHSTSFEQPKDIFFQPLNLTKEHNSTQKEIPGNVATNISDENRKRKFELSSPHSKKLMKKDEVCKKISQASTEIILNNEDFVYIMTQSDSIINMCMSNIQYELIPEAKCFYPPKKDCEIYSYYYIPEDPKIPSEIRFFNELHLTIHNIPFNIELFIELNYKHDKDVIVNEKYIDTQDNKLFVYNRSFRLFYKEKQCPWHKFSVRAQKCKSSTIMKKFIEPIYLQKYKFPIYNIPKLIELNTQLGTNRVIWLKDEIIAEKNLATSIFEFAKDAVSSTSILHLESTNSAIVGQKTDKHKNFEGIKDIIKICDFQFWSISDPISLLYGKEVESNIKIVLSNLRNASVFSGLGLIRTEPLSEEQIELISLIAFINQNVVNIGLKYLDRYEKFVGKKMKFNEVFIIPVD